MIDHNDQATQTDLAISRLIKAPISAVWEAWSRPEHLVKWWCPKPWMTKLRAFDLRPGGAFHTFMSGPDGGESDNPGIFLEVVPRERIVFTSMLTEGWQPANAWLPMTAIIAMAEEDGSTRYTATVLHKDAADRKRHEDMGFHEGWGICISQLAEVAGKIASE